MLVRFAVENFLSFKEENTLSMIAAKNGPHPDHVIKAKQGKPISLLRAAALYGANASGKSNLVEAIDFAKQLIIEGTKGNQRIAVVPFRLSKSSLLAASKFEFTIRYEGNLYVYGFKLNSKEVLEEWLFGTPKSRKREVKYFERVTLQNSKTRIEFGPTLSGNRAKNQQFLEFVAKGTRPNQLFLTEAVERNVTELKSLINWFTTVLQIIRAESTYSALELTAHKDRKFTAFLGSFLKTAGTGIEGVEAKRLPFDFDKIDELPEEEKKRIKADVLKGSDYVITIGHKQYGVTLGKNKQPVLIGLKTLHRSSENNSVLFDLEEESEGTQRLLHLVPALANSKIAEKVYVIDELDRRLHPLLSKMFLKAYLQTNGEPAKGQMVFTTHDTNLLDHELLRRDEVWFVEKDAKGSSHLYSLADFKIRPGLKIRKGYLNGRFGAIPFIGDTSRLGWASKSQ